MITETSTTASALPSIKVRPGLAVNPLRAAPLDVGRATHPAATLSTPRSDMVPDGTKCAPAACQNAGLWDGHIHQLFRQLHSSDQGSHRDVLENDPGHFDNLFGHLDVASSSCSTICGTQTSIHLHNESKFVNVFHGVPRNPLLRSRRLDQTGRPPPARFFLVELEELRLGRRGLLSPWRVVLVLVPLLFGPGGSLQCPWGALLCVHFVRVVHHRCQGHADRLLFVLEHRTQPPLLVQF